MGAKGFAFCAVPFEPLISSEFSSFYSGFSWFKMLDLESSPSSSSSSSKSSSPMVSNAIQPLPSLMSLNVRPPPIRRPEVLPPGSGSPSQQLHILVISQPPSVRNAIQAVHLYPGRLISRNRYVYPVDISESIDSL